MSNEIYNSLLSFRILTFDKICVKKNFIFRFFIGFWALAVVSLVSLLGTWHQSDFAVAGTFKGKTMGSADGKWKMLHLMAGECQCSEYVTDYLIKRGPSSLASEKVTILDDTKDFASRLRAAGFEVEVKKYEDLKEDELPSGVPLLLVVSPLGKVVYEGGYSNRQINPLTQFQDLHVLANAQSETKESHLPAYGCYVAKKYQKKLDPLNLKYE